MVRYLVQDEISTKLLLRYLNSDIRGKTRNARSLCVDGGTTQGGAVLLNFLCEALRTGTVRNAGKPRERNVTDLHDSGGHVVGTRRDITLDI